MNYAIISTFYYISTFLDYFQINLGKNTSNIFSVTSYWFSICKKKDSKTVFKCTKKVHWEKIHHGKCFKILNNYKTFF